MEERFVVVECHVFELYLFDIGHARLKSLRFLGFALDDVDYFG